MRNIPIILSSLFVSIASSQAWEIANHDQWTQTILKSEGLELKNGTVTPVKEAASFKSTIKKFSERKAIKSIVIEQTSAWSNWKKVPNVGPKNAKDAPVFLSLKDKDYWMFARYGGGAIDQVKVSILKIEEKVYMRQMSREVADKEIAELLARGGTNEGQKGGGFAQKDAQQTNGSGGEMLGLGGYHAWHSTDLQNWVHHGPVSNYKSRWMTTAEYKDGKFYLYYDNPNDQDPHLIIDADLTDGKIGDDRGLVFADPSNGSDNAVIRGADGKFHFIYEDWSPLNASKQAWDSPLAGHAVSDDGITDWKILPPAIDLRTKPTGRVLEYKHPHQYPAMLKYDVHLPKQDAFGDWAAILVGDRYYLFGDYDPASNNKGSKGMSVAWFTSESLDKPFTKCGNIGQGHPDPDIAFAEGQFYLITQFNEDFVSPGPWVNGVQGRAGVDIDNDGVIDQWTDWQVVRESYDHKPGYAKHVLKKPATIDTSSLQKGYGFQFEVKLVAPQQAAAQPVLDSVRIEFE